ncbi:Uncharacterised protein [Mycobacteroides abscessus subsp. bolletii]|nr:Uncharacterised protein [Mycobacteroides abscessus subsp. bolletii]SKX18451.1 Uncharacterised protein [Mycobacteroides abscessus subsp. bolletii]
MFWTYLRATHFWEVKWPGVREVLLTIAFGQGRKRSEVTGTMNVTVRPVSASIGLEGFTPLVEVRHATPEERIKNLEERLNKLLNTDLPPVRRDVKKLKNEIEKVRSLAKSEAEKALADARAEIAKLAKDLDRTQTLDLRWAALGVFISGIGTALQYWA